MYPVQHEIKDTTDSNNSASYLDLLLSIRRDDQLRTSLYDKRDDFNFHITNFPFLSSNIPSLPVYGVFISRPIRHVRACSSCECFILRAVRLSYNLLGQGYVRERLKSSLLEFHGSDMGISSSIMKSRSPKFNMTFWDMIIYNDTLHLSGISPNRDLITEPDRITVFDVITLFREVSIGHLRRVWPTEDAYSSGHLVLSVKDGRTEQPLE